MENATKALLMAAGVLIGVLILSLGVYLFYIFGGFAADTQSKVDANQIAQFNAKFLQYVGRTDLTIQDIITAKNYALENNQKDRGYNARLAKYKAKDSNDYIDVFFDHYNFEANIEMLKSNRRYMILRISDEALLSKEIKKINEGKNPARFKCEVEFNNVTGKVNGVYFYEP